MSTTTARTRSPWDDVEHAILRAVQQPATCLSVADRATLTPDTVKAQLLAFEGEGLVTQPVPGAGRYQLTLAGYQRLFALSDRPGHQAAA